MSMPIIFEEVKDTQTCYDVLDQFDTFFEPNIHVVMPDREGSVKKLLQNGHFVIAKLEQDIIGFATFYANDLLTKCSHMTMGGIHPRVQRMGIGKALMSECMRIAKISGMEKAHTIVENRNEKSQRSIMSLGFRPTTAYDDKRTNWECDL